MHVFRARTHLFAPCLQLEEVEGQVEDGLRLINDTLLQAREQRLCVPHTAPTPPQHALTAADTQA